MAKDLYLYVYIPSVEEFNMYCNKFKAFMTTKLSEKARINGAYVSGDYGTGYYFLRTPSKDSNLRVFGVSGKGSLCYIDTNTKNSGLSPLSFQLNYNSESDIVKNCKIKSNKEEFWDNNTQSYIDVTSIAPIVVFGEKECIWLNKEECESGKDKTMKLWTLELVDCAKPYYIDGKEKPTNDFGQAKALLAQCESALVEGCTKEELDMLIMVKMNKKDNYEKVTPILDKSLDKSSSKFQPIKTTNSGRGGK